MRIGSFSEMTYKEFLNNKKFILESSGFDISKEHLNTMLYGFQKDIVRWALAKGRAAIFADCGLGKTLMQLEWADKVSKHTSGKVLILAPLSVTEQTIREGNKFGIPVTLCKEQSDAKDGINITNYEKLDRFVAKEFTGVILDESSILKSFTGKVRTQIIDNFANAPFKLACTATPAPNDYMELGNHSEFLGVMTRAEMLAMFFVHDGGETSKWRLKGHAKEPAPNDYMELGNHSEFLGVMTRAEMLAMFFVHDGGETSKWRLKGHAKDIFWQWMASWSVFIDNPANLGYEIMGYNLPKLNITEICVDGTPTSEILSLTERRQARKDSLVARCEQAAELVNHSQEQWIVWCDLNDESAKLHEMITDSVEICGADKPNHKSDSMLGFSEGNIKCLVTKPKIAGFGMNWQNCHNMIFTGLSDSYEAYYQALRRCWRFGQSKEVNVYIIISSKEGCVKENIERKEADFRKMQSAMIELTKEITKKELEKTCRISTPYNPRIEMVLPKWEEF